MKINDYFKDDKIKDSTYKQHNEGDMKSRNLIKAESPVYFDGNKIGTAISLTQNSEDYSEDYGVGAGISVGSTINGVMNSLMRIKLENVYGEKFIIKHITITNSYERAGFFIDLLAVCYFSEKFNEVSREYSYNIFFGNELFEQDFFSAIHFQNCIFDRIGLYPVECDKVRAITVRNGDTILDDVILRSKARDPITGTAVYKINTIDDDKKFDILKIASSKLDIRRD